MTMTPQLRKLALTTHLTFSVGWIGAVVVYLVLGITATTSQDVQTVRAVWIAMELTGWYSIVPLAVGSLLTGIVMAVGTKWGLFRYYWVLFSLLLTILSTLVLLLHMPTVSSMAVVAQQAEGTRLDELGGDLLHPSIGLVVLLVIQAINIYKPQGMTRLGQRKVPGRTRRGSITGIPRWMKVFVVITAALGLLFVIFHLFNGGIAGH